MNGQTASQPGGAARRTLAIGTSALALALAFSSPAAAQESGRANAAAKDEAVADIVVTAQFRSQRLQDTPLAVSAVTGAVLEAKGQTNLAHLGSSTPNLTIEPTGDALGPAAAIYIRGIGQYDSNLALEPGVGVYIDDVYYSTVFGTDFDLVDLDRIEVLRGPQGTLAGKNSIGGALKLYSKQPDDAFGGYGEITTGRFDRVDLRGAINVPIVKDTLAMRVSGVRNHSDGYVTRYDYGCLYPASGVPATTANASCKLGTSGGRDSWGMRGILAWTPSTTLDVSLTGDYSEDHSSPGASVSTYVNGMGRTFLNGTPFDARFVTAGTYTSYATYRDPGGIYPAMFGPGATVVQASGFQPDPDTDLKAWGVSLRAKLDLSPDSSLTSITAYRGYDGTFTTDGDGTPFNYQLNQQDLRHRQFSQELRLTGQAGSLIDYTVGGFYFDEQNVQGGRVQIPTIQDIDIDDRISARSYSAFVHATMHVTEAFDLTGGIRYSDDRKRYTYARTQSPLDGVTAVYSGDRLDYKLNASYRFTPDIMAFAQFSTGYRSGGTNPRPFFPNQAVAFKPETLDAYEVGLKTSWLDRRMTANFNAFINRYNDILVSSTSAYTNPDMPVDEDPMSPGFNPAAGTFPAFVVLNGGQAVIKGMEAAIEARPTASLRIDGSASYLDFHYTSLSTQAVAIGLTRNSALPFAPRWKWSAGVENAFPLGRLGTLTPRIDISHQGMIYTQAVPTPLTRIDGYTLANARLTWTDPSDSWRVSFAVLNLTNKYYYLTRFDTSDQSGTATAQPGRPREWTLSLRRNF